MSYILDVFMCSLVTLGEVIGAIVIALMLQLISYRILKINLYQKLVKIINK